MNKKLNKIVLLGLRDLFTEEKIEPQTDYGLFLIAQRVSEEKEDSESDDESVIKYRLKIDHIDYAINLKTSKEFGTSKGYTPSQKQRFAIEREVGSDDYESMMNWLLGKIPGLAEEYRNNP